ncbi:MAG: 4-hydroxythreonine-4-phosphate dehydrogenase PdxA [Cellvibrionaceae bacterium]|nr:4-hydroxythreonine-4-phosphate dehydrogenase PdxA [Cellvibrionaceae bacterium]
MTLRIALTPGEPAGIGPDLAVTLAQQPQQHELVAFADPDLLLARAKQLRMSLQLTPIDLSQPPVPLRPQELGIVPIKLAGQVELGHLNIRNAPYVLQSLDAAILACQQQECAARVTGPVQKSVINDAGIAFSGHTEYLAEKTHQSRVVMMLATEGLRVALATTHLPLKEVAAAINQALLIDVITILRRDLQAKFNIQRPKILVCGLNPHAGEQGHLGREELDIIQPALRTLKQKDIICTGPLPADTVFTPKHLSKADAVLAMYHDQGLPVLKYKGFGNAANITLGLPFVRTSVDHGTALDMAGTGLADTSSLATAIHAAIQMAATATGHI